jgi:IS605 OrfB family transposase
VTVKTGDEMPTQFLTCVFKLADPTNNKKTVLDYVFIEYTNAVKSMLVEAQTRINDIATNGVYEIKNKKGEIIGRKYTSKSIMNTLPKSGQLSFPINSSLKESVINNVSVILASYLALTDSDKQEAGYPEILSPKSDEKDWRTIWYDIGTAITLKDENEAKANLTRVVKAKPLPIHYIRARDLTLLYNRKKNTFWVWLKLLPSKSQFNTKMVVIADDGFVNQMTGEVFTYRGKSAIMFPLQIGQRNGGWGWQYHKFLEPLQQGQATIKAAKLIQKQGEYFLHVSFAFEVPEPYLPASYIGIDRGVFHSMAYGIVDLDGRIVKMGHNPDGFRDVRIEAGLKVQAKQKRGKAVSVKDYKRRHLDNILHVVINDVITQALKHKSMIVLEDLDIQIRGKFFKSAWRKMYNILEYKCKLFGIPFWKKGIWAAYSSQICIYCGERNEDRKRDGTPFECPACSAVYHSDEGAGINIARRVLYRKKDWEDKGGYFTFHRSFANLGDFDTKNSLRTGEKKHL